jgi:hypothetical protein
VQQELADPPVLLPAARTQQHLGVPVRALLDITLNYISLNISLLVFPAGGGRPGGSMRREREAATWSPGPGEGR